MKYFTLFLFSFLFVNCSISQKDLSPPYKYLVFEPDGFEIEGTYPLLIFLHGAGERGEDLEKLKVHGPPKLIESGQKFECLVLAPLCPEEVWWDIEKLETLLTYIKSKYNIDSKRIWLTGLSMGGYGTWLWSSAYPDNFAAIAPICGGGDEEKVTHIKDIPVWAFHGAKDDVVLLSESQKMIDALESIGARPKFTIYPDADHDSWTKTYNNPEFFKWLFSHKK